MMDQGHRSAMGGFLDDLPKAVYVVAHIAFFVVGIGLWVHARSTTFPAPGALLMYVASQAVFFAFFADSITLKMAVLLEQTLMLLLLCVLVVSAS